MRDQSSTVWCQREERASDARRSERGGAGREGKRRTRVSVFCYVKVGKQGNTLKNQRHERMRMEKKIKTSRAWSKGSSWDNEYI